MPTHKRRVLSEDEDEDAQTSSFKPNKKNLATPDHERFSSEESSEPENSRHIQSPTYNDEMEDDTNTGHKRERNDTSSRMATKRRRILDNDEHEEEEFELDRQSAGLPDDYSDDEEFIEDEEATKKGKKKAGTKSKATGKTRGIEPLRGKKLAADNMLNRQRSAKLKHKSATDESMDVDVVKDSQPSVSRPASPSQLAKTTAAPPPAKKKLPTIRKIKTTESEGANALNKSSALATSPQDGLGLGGAPLLRKLHHDHPDINLNDSSVYNDLFKTVGNPRTSASKAKEDKQRELYRMRDEAKAKRLAEVVSTFDLQAQSEKIASFEARLRAQKSGALYPNCLAAKWKECFERTMRAKEQAKAEADREEGEVTLARS